VTIGQNLSSIHTTRVAALGSAVDSGLGTWGGTVPSDYRERFALAYDREVQAWVDATRRGEVVGPTSWDGYAATAVCTAGMESLHTGEPVRVRLADRAALPPTAWEPTASSTTERHIHGTAPEDTP
jgi:myo-inositol 2-dehydrogenase/D-chiro-inositol 1-dehydrogenase